MSKTIALAAALVLALSVASFAHHPFDEEFDWKKPITLTGTVSRVEMANPHSYLYVKSSDAGGANEWKIELGPMSQLNDFGWKTNAVKTGDKVSVDAWQGKKDPKLAAARSVKLPDGKYLAGGSTILDIRESAGKSGNTPSQQK